MVAKKWYKARPVVQKVTSLKTGLTYDSQLEATLHEGVLESFDKHPCKIPYTIEHNYHPDFIKTKADGTRLIIETKGFFQDSSECAKYKWIRSELPEGDELVFIFQRPDSKLPWSSKRKDGTFLSHVGWACLNSFRAYGQDVTLEELLNE